MAQNEILHHVQIVGWHKLYDVVPNLCVAFLNATSFGFM
jgi:hypothetical protein